MAKQFLEIEVDVPEGYQAIGYRQVKYGEHWLVPDGSVDVWRAAVPSMARHMVLKEVKPLSDEEATERTRDILEAIHAGKSSRSATKRPPNVHGTSWKLSTQVSKPH